MSLSSSHAISVRRPVFQHDAMPYYFFDDNPLLTYFLLALSLTFPEGERFFVHSVRQVRDQVTSASLQQAIAGFIGQEAMHSRAHEHFNQIAQDRGIAVAAILADEKAKIALAKKRLTAQQQLAVTCALEHFTAIIAEYLLENESVLSGLDHTACQLWECHAVEEAEHKAVAFDVYQSVYANLAVRRRVMRIVTVTFLSRITQLTVQLLWADRRGRHQWSQHWNGAKRIYRVARDLHARYLDYYRADFHPHDHDNTALLSRWIPRLAA